MEKLLTPKDTARYLGLSLSATYKLIADGELPHLSIKQRKGFRVRRSDVEQWKEKHLTTVYSRAAA